MSDPERDRDFEAFAEMFERGVPAGEYGRPRGPAGPAVRGRRRRRGRIIALVVVCAIVAAIAVYVPLVLTAPVGAAASTAHRPDVAPPAAAPLVMPPDGESAISVSGADEYLGADASSILASQGGNAAVPIASISKLITAMVVLDAKPLSGAADPGPTLTFDKADHALYDKYYLLNATIAAMPTGTTMSEHDAIETMLVVSACNYAEAVSTWAFGSQAAFLSAAKRWLAAHGMVHTTMVEPTGLDTRNRSTPGDMIALGKLAMADPAVAAIVAMPRLDIPFLQGQPNTNDLIGIDGITGIKTGTLDSSGSDLLFSATVGVGAAKPLQLIGVVLSSASHSSANLDVKNLIDSIKAGFHDVPVAEGGQEVGSYSTPWGASATMVLASSATIFTYSDTPIASTMTTTALKTGKDGEKVGAVTWKAGTSTVTVPVILKGSIRPPTAWWRLTHPQLLGG